MDEVIFDTTSEEHKSVPARLLNKTMASEILKVAKAILSDDKIPLSEVQLNSDGTAKGVPAFLAKYNPQLMKAKSEPNVFTFRRGYFYRSGMDDTKFANMVKDWLDKKGFNGDLIDSGDHWAAFHGGAKEFSSQSSFFWATFKVSRKEATTSPVVTASMQRFCMFYLAKDGNWYMDLANKEYGDHRDATTYGPFVSLEKAREYCDDHFSNPGSFSVSKSGDDKVPTRSPNGKPVVKPNFTPWRNR